MTLAPTSNSKTSKKRKNRGFRSLELDSRIHRRALQRQLNGRKVTGKELKPGEKIMLGVKSQFTGAGALKYH